MSNEIATIYTIKYGIEIIEELGITLPAINRAFRDDKRTVAVNKIAHAAYDHLDRAQGLYNELAHKLAVEQELIMGE